MSFETSDTAIVSLGDQDIGLLERRGEASRFVPSEAWAETPAGERPVLGQQFEEDPFAAHASRYGAPIWFEHLLPEAGGPLRMAVARSLGIAEPRSFLLLLALGDDLPGAVRIRRESQGSISTIARRERANGDSAVSRPALPLRVSLAGLQFKISARVGRRGIVVPAAGGDGDWIIKFADQRFATLPQNEFLTMNWASAAGLAVPEVRLLATSEIQGIESMAEATGDLAFAIRRYDRADNGRIHQEDFAQVLGLPPGDAKYTDTNIDTIVRVLRALAPEDLEELLARLVFCVLCGNDDAHAKNWSLWYPDSVRPRLAPAYDLVSTVEYYPKNAMSLKLAKARRFEQVDRARFRRLAARTGLKETEVDDVVVRHAQRQLAAWEETRAHEAMTTEYRHLIDARLKNLRLVRDVR